MKPKALTNKLSLNKVTISDLSDEKMQNVLGGTNNSDNPPCFTYLYSQMETFCPNFTCAARFCEMTQYPDMLC